MGEEPVTREPLFSSFRGKAAFFLIELFLVFLFLGLILSRPNPDEGIFATGGWLLLQGTVLYTEIFSMYSPGIYFVFAAFFSIFPFDFVASRLFVLAVNVVTLALFFLLCRKLVSEKPALLASFFYVVWAAFTISWNIIIEPFLVLFCVSLVYCIFSFLDSRRFSCLALVGFLLSGIVLLKQPMVFFSLAATGFFLLRARLNRKEFVALAVSYAVVPLLVIFYLVSNNAFFAFLDQAVFRNLTHSSIFAFRLHLGWLSVSSLFFSLLLLALLLLLFRKLDVKRDRLVLVFLWFLCTVPTLLPVLGCCAHFTPLVPAFAIFFALVFEAVFIRARSFRFRQLELAPLLKLFVALVFAVSVFASSIYLSQYFLKNDFVELFEMAEYVRSNSSPDDTIHVTWWDEEMYLLCRRKPATKYLFTPFLFEDEIPGYEQEVIAKLEETRPLFAINFSRLDRPFDGESGIYDYLSENYSVVFEKKMQKPLYNTFNYGFVLRRNQE